MSDQDNLRDRIKRLVDETDDGDSAARAIIDEFGLTTRGTCGYVEIYGNYDTKFEENDQ